MSTLSDKQTVLADKLQQKLSSFQGTNEYSNLSDLGVSSNVPIHIQKSLNLGITSIPEVGYGELFNLGIQQGNVSLKEGVDRLTNTLGVTDELQSLNKYLADNGLAEPADQIIPRAKEVSKQITDTKDMSSILNFQKDLGTSADKMIQAYDEGSITGTLSGGMDWLTNIANNPKAASQLLVQSTPQAIAAAASMQGILGRDLALKALGTLGVTGLAAGQGKVNYDENLAKFVKDNGRQPTEEENQRLLDFSDIAGIAGVAGDAVLGKLLTDPLIKSGSRSAIDKLANVGDNIALGLASEGAIGGTEAALNTYGRTGEIDKELAKEVYVNSALEASAGGVASAIGTVPTLTGLAVDNPVTQATVDTIKSGFATEQDKVDPVLTDTPITPSNITYPTGYTMPSFEGKDSTYSPIEVVDSSVNNIRELTESRPDSLPVAERLELIIKQAEELSSQKKDLESLIADTALIGLDTKEVGQFKSSIANKAKEIDKTIQDSLIAISNELDANVNDPMYSAKKDEVSSNLLGSIDFSTTTKSELEDIKASLVESDRELVDALFDFNKVSQQIRNKGFDELRALDGSKAYDSLAQYIIQARQGKPNTKDFASWINQTNDFSRTEAAQGLFNVERNLPKTFKLVNDVNTEAKAINKAIDLYNSIVTKNNPNAETVPNLFYREFKLKGSDTTYSPSKFFSNNLDSPINKLPSKYKTRLSNGNYALTESAYKDGIVQLTPTGISPTKVANTATTTNAKDTLETPQDLVDDFSSSMESLVEQETKTEQKSLQEVSSTVDKVESKKPSTKFKLESTDVKQSKVKRKSKVLRETASKVKRANKTLKQFITSVGGIDKSSLENQDRLSKNNRLFRAKYNGSTLDDLVSKYENELRTYFPNKNVDLREAVQEALYSNEDVFTEEVSIKLKEIEAYEIAQQEYIDSRQLELDFNLSSTTKVDDSYYNLGDASSTSVEVSVEAIKEDLDRYLDTAIKEDRSIIREASRATYDDDGNVIIPESNIGAFNLPGLADILSSMDKQELKELSRSMINYLKGC